MNPWNTIKYQLYLFQLENYNIRRFFRLALKFLKRTAYPPRKELVWTPKAILIFAIALVLAILVLLAGVSPFSFWAFRIIGGLFLIYILPIIFFFFLIIAVILVYPLDALIKWFVIRSAKRKIANFPNLQIIGITGSYGKTTMKEVLREVLSIKYQILSTPESVNTPVGVARLILKKLNENIQIFIVEMGAYRRGEIQALCEIARPDIAVLTGINEAHLERFGNLENTIAAKFEVVVNARTDALVVLNEDSELIRRNYQGYLGRRKIKYYSVYSPFQPPLTLGGGGELPLLGEYAKGVINGAVIIAKVLGLNDAEISAGIKQITPVPHRLQPILNQRSNILVVDDSYSGNPDGVREAIKVLSGFNDRRKIYITPGLVEMGARSREVHLEIGRQLAKVADLVILIKNSVTLFINEGIICSPHERAKVIWFENSQEAHAALPKILQSGDVILFQNDWPENYA